MCHTFFFASIFAVFCVIYFFLYSNYFLFLIITHFFVMNSLVGGF
ncbi:hypothetical protein ROSINTL182_07271 [Roseburia intestinalis L1-82]|uniref:Uncharacterized protein n=1 Tax=Roseburia intestinalis L1-82 TaxID=536231 RepID=C7GBI7_9FIRM|nr:hypothetical protein ROSINTL182_07271 [Roseburia intestinalis L1-82]